ncbi:MAG: prepilin peptidase, partial [Clostridia bacterium]|nr:prepilin peptidase [Clostridia bacterium]
MEVIFYIIIFIIGALFGSFYTLAVYRIPKRQDIIYTHSYCPNCKQKLGLLDLFPIISYIALGGKCRYCKEKIRPRYLILEILSGAFFVITAISMKLSIYTLNVENIIKSIFIVLYITYIILIAGIDKEERKIDNLVNIYGIVISVIYMIYLCIVKQANIYRYGIYVGIYILLLFIYKITDKKKKEKIYFIETGIQIVTMAVFTGLYATFNSVLVIALAVAIYLLINKISKQNELRNDEQIIGEIGLSFCLSFINIITYIAIL